MAGWLSNGVTFINALLNNGVALSPVPYTNLSASGARVYVDTDQSSGAQPQGAAASPFQIAACAAGMIENTTTSTVHTGTLNTTSGRMITESLSTAAGATYTFQIVNSLITATGAIPEVQMHDVSNTAGAAQVTSITNTAGTATVVFTNTGTAAWNGTKAILFHV
jgi:hypothetical protein